MVLFIVDLGDENVSPPFIKSVNGGIINLYFYNNPYLATSVERSFNQKNINTSKMFQRHPRKNGDQSSSPVV